MDAGYSSEVVLNDYVAFHQAITQTEVLTIAEDFLLKRIYELSAAYPELNREPVRCIDKVVVENGLAVNL